jgi:hypothetical protein
MNQILVEAQYIGSCSFWAHLLQADKIYLDGHEHYVKRSYRNRAHILGANGLLRLSIPLVSGKHQHSAMKDVRISYNEPWQKLHWQSFTSAYRRSPFFEFYEDQFTPFYTEQYEYLLTYNVAFMKAISKILKIELPIDFTEAYAAVPSGSVKDLRNSIKPGALTKDLSPYTQVFSDRFEFSNDLCVLDALFNLGNSTKEYLTSIKV